MLIKVHGMVNKFLVFSSHSFAPFHILPIVIIIIIIVIIIDLYNLHTYYSFMVIALTESSGAHRVTTSSLTMEVEAVTHAIQWLASQRDARITHVVILTDSMNLLQKVESGMGCPDWHTAMHSLRLQRLLWIYCPGHAGVSGNERADRLASTADITSGLQLGRAEVLRGLRNFLSTDKPEHHSIDRLKERGVEKGSGRHSTLQGRERSVFNQTNIGTVSRATLGRLLRDEAERVWAFPSATMPS